MEAPTSGAGGAGVGAGAAGAGTGAFAVFTSHGRAARAREVLSAVLPPSSVVMTVAHGRERGACFLVHAGVADVDGLMLLADDGTRGGEEGRDVEGGDGAGRLFDGFVAIPPSLKLAPSLLDHGGGGGSVDDERRAVANGSTEAGGEELEEGWLPTTSPGKALRRNSGVEGLVVRLLLLSPQDEEPAVDGGEPASLAERWRRDWSSPSLDLHDLSFWTALDGHPARRRRGDKEDGERETYTAVLAREWGGAARTVHALAERLGGVSPAEACGWNGVRVEVDSPGLVTLRGIGHLLPGRGPGGGGGAGGGAGQTMRGSDDDGNGETEKTACLMGLVSFLASRPEVARVSALPRAELANAVAGAIVQGASATSTPLWDRGVDGSGEVVQVRASEQASEWGTGGEEGGGKEAFERVLPVC